MIQDTIQTAQHQSTDQWVAVMSSIAASVNVLAIAYARHKGRKRDPEMRAIRSLLKRIAKELGVTEDETP